MMKLIKKEEAAISGYNKSGMPAAVPKEIKNRNTIRRQIFTGRISIAIYNRLPD
ncbi:MAG: hypothetical protein ABI472_12535 [Ginsengibacter sp.]